VLIHPEFSRYGVNFARLFAFLDFAAAFGTQRIADLHNCWPTPGRGKIRGDSRARVRTMSVRFAFAGLAILACAGCQTTDPLDKYQQPAIDTALQRARFEMNCPQASATVLSRKTIEPVSIRFGVARAEYTLGVEGCGQRNTMTVLCAEDGSGCVAAK
jgi:hypothetical protein